MAKDPLKNQKALKDIPEPSERPYDWIRKDVKVCVILHDETETICFKLGHISSQIGSHDDLGMEADNVRKTVVWFNDAGDPIADTADEKYERPFNPKDPCLMRCDEFLVLCDEKRAATWFEGKEYDADDIKLITQLAQRLIGFKASAKPQRKKKRSRNRRSE